MLGLTCMGNKLQKIKGASPVSEGDFEKLIGGMVMVTPFFRLV